MKVRAQRKFAQKTLLNFTTSAGITAGVPSCSGLQKETADEHLTPPLYYTCVSAGDLINRVAFQNIHVHANDKTKETKEVRVVLNRLPSPLTPSTLTETQFAVPQLKTFQTKAAGTRRITPAGPIVVCKRRRTVSIAGSENIRLRTRTICRRPQFITRNEKSTKLLITKNVKTTKLQRNITSPLGSDTSIDDDQPLAYYAEKNHHKKENVPHKTLAEVTPITNNETCKPSTSAVREVTRKPETENPTRVKNVGRRAHLKRNKKLPAPISPLKTAVRTFRSATLRNRENIGKRGRPIKKPQRKKTVAIKKKVTDPSSNKDKAPNQQQQEQQEVTQDAVPYVFEISLKVEELEGSRSNAQPENEHFDLSETSKSLRLMFESDASVQALPELTAPENDTTVLNLVNTLSDFIKNIFNWVDCEEDVVGSRRPSILQDNEPEKESGPTMLQENELENDAEPNVPNNKEQLVMRQKRVQDWLVKSHSTVPIAATIPPIKEGNFKVPMTPAPRKWTVRIPTSEVPTPPVSSSSVSTARFFPPVSHRERAARTRCTAWRYERLSSVATKPDMIPLFCFECTRCTIMFQTDVKLGETQTNLHSSRLGTSGSVSDVYDFSEKDGNIQNDPITPYRLNRIKENIKHFKTISKKPGYLSLFRQCLTDVGKKILSASVIVNDKVHKGIPLLPKDQILLAQVLGILTKTNEGQVETPIPARKRTHQGSSNSALRQNPKNSRIPTKRTRQSMIELDNLERVSSSISGEGRITESVKINATENDFAEGPAMFAIKIQKKYQELSFCGIKPPASFKPECNINDQSSRFKLRNQYIHRMLQRWSPATKELTVFRSVQDPKIQRSPLVDGLEIDLVRLYQAVKEENGLMSVQNGLKWGVITKKMNLPSNPKTRKKVEKAFYKYCLEYETLQPSDRARAEKQVEECWQKRQTLAMDRADSVLWRKDNLLSWAMMRNSGDDEEPRTTSHIEAVCAEAEDCISPGRTANFNSLKKLAQQVQAAYFPNVKQPTPEQVETEYWYYVMQSSTHVCVYSASIDAMEHGYGFTMDRMDNYRDHPWNIKALIDTYHLTEPETAAMKGAAGHMHTTYRAETWLFQIDRLLRSLSQRLSISSTNLLSHLGRSLGVSSPTLHYGMTFTTSCWHMDPTMVPWIEYLHHGSPKIWYSISAHQGEKFRSVALDLCPFVVQNKKVWLPCDVIMIPPAMLRQRGIDVQRHVQHPGEYVIVFPNTYYACLDTGFSVSEGVYFAPHNWISNADSIFQNLHENMEPSLFSLPKLLIAMTQSDSTPFWVFKRSHDLLRTLLHTEMSSRQSIVSYNIEMLTQKDFMDQHISVSKSPWQVAEHGECAYCRCTLYFSRVIGLTEGMTAVCAEHGVVLYGEVMAQGMQITNVYCIVFITNTEMHTLMQTLDNRVRAAATQTLPNTSPVASQSNK